VNLAAVAAASADTLLTQQASIQLEQAVNLAAAARLLIP
jgi:hypothetical protein